MKILIKYHSEFGIKDKIIKLEEFKKYQKKLKIFDISEIEINHRDLFFSEKEEIKNHKKKINKDFEFDKRYLEMAKIWSNNSYCERRKVGALVVKDSMIISDGYNGTPTGFENICEEDGVTKNYVLHAEANAITKIAKSNNNSDGATLYVTTAPCVECSKLIIQSGIKRVVFIDEYRKNGLEILKKSDIIVNQIKI